MIILERTAWSPTLDMVLVDLQTADDDEGGRYALALVPTGSTVVDVVGPAYMLLENARTAFNAEREFPTAMKGRA